MAGGLAKYIPTRRKQASTTVQFDAASSDFTFDDSWPLPPLRGTGQWVDSLKQEVSKVEPQSHNDVSKAQLPHREAALRKANLQPIDIRQDYHMTINANSSNSTVFPVKKPKNDDGSINLKSAGKRQQLSTPIYDSYATQRDLDPEESPILKEDVELLRPNRLSKELWETSPNEPSAALSRSGSRVRIGYPENESFNDSRENGPKVSGLRKEEPSSVGYVCDSCHKQRLDAAYCNVCLYTFCPQCWEMQITHRNQNRLTPNEVPHEKTDRHAALQISDILGPQTDSAKQIQLHTEDEKTTWFGVIREENCNPIFQDYGRYANLMSDIGSRGKFAHYDTRFPGLVSFVGQTGAGKSTLIKLIIDLSTRENEKFETPIVGSVKDQDVPTSGDVHLYPDPASIASRSPILYADCEGLEGGEREPISARFKKNKQRLTGIGRVSSLERKAKKTQHISERDITWADTPKKRSREFAVTHLYPRLLYTFSDVVVFVLKNPRTIEGVFEKLVDWAAAALEKSSNQPVLPHVIIVLNAAENSTPPELWDPEVATKSLLKSLSETISENSKFKEYTAFWSERQRQVDTVEQLLLSYYSSVKVVRIPTHGRPNLIVEQVAKLYNCISTACWTSRKRKGELRMLLNANELQPYLQYAFDHFACDLDSPFDFVQASFVNSPIPSDFGGNILKLAINMMEVWKDVLPGETLFTELSYMVASCIMLDSARHGIKGNAAQIFPQYVEHLDAALLNFCDRHWPCEFQTVSGARCVNVRSGHGSKGHQLKSGKVLAVGDYSSEFSFQEHQKSFQYNVYFRLDQLLHRLREHRHHPQNSLTEEPAPTEEQAATDLHRNNVIKNFYNHASRDRSNVYVSHTACFCCLFESPDHVLPCGHALCTLCVKGFGTPLMKNVIEITHCPVDGRDFSQDPWTVVLKPETSGIRILTLDGGGIRGVVELEILRQIESHLNGISIKSFFDLIVGTSTGGIISLGLVSNDWSVDHCTRKFKELCGKAFTARSGSNIPIAGFLVELHHQSKYETQPLQEALIESFGKNNLFGGPRQRTLGNVGSDIKVAVTSTSTSGNAVVFANYNRPSRDKLSYQFQRPEKLSAELKTWEAARATSAAPRIFKPMCHESSKQVYIDGAIYHNNPIQIADQERKLHWPHLAESPPDIVLSIGTGYNPDSSRRRRMQRTSTLTLGPAMSQIKNLLRIAMDHLAASIDAEKTWDNYFEFLPPKHRDRYVRLNPRLSGTDPPALDQVDQMHNLKRLTQMMMREDSRIEQVAFQLIATSFYFEKTGPLEALDGEEVEVKGHILCRLIDGSLDVVRLGNLLKSLSAQPSFVIQEQHRSEQAMRVPIPYEVIENMITARRFKLKVTIKLSSRLSESEISLSLNTTDLFRISNFPRSLLGDDTYSTGKRYTISQSSSRWAGRSHKHNRNSWVPPDPGASDFVPDVISSYSSPTYTLNNISPSSLAPLATYESQKKQKAQTMTKTVRISTKATIIKALTKKRLSPISPEMLPTTEVFEMMDTSSSPQLDEISVGDENGGFI